jgi:hypothetical protein
MTVRRLFVEHWTEQDFEMERIGREQSREVYKKRVAQIEAAGWVPFRGPYYYAGREFHGGHLVPQMQKRVPSEVAFEMFREQNPEVELEPYRPHPHGWTPPTTTQGLFHQEVFKVEPMKVPAGLIFYQNLGIEQALEPTEEQRRQERLKATFKDLPGVRSYGTWHARARVSVSVKIEAEEYRAAIPTTWEGLEVEIEVKSEAQEVAEKKASRALERDRLREETEWLKKAGLA